MRTQVHISRADYQSQMETAKYFQTILAESIVTINLKIIYQGDILPMSSLCIDLSFVGICTPSRKKRLKVKTTSPNLKWHWKSRNEYLQLQKLCGQKLIFKILHLVPWYEAVSKVIFGTVNLNSRTCYMFRSSSKNHKNINHNHPDQCCSQQPQFNVKLQLWKWFIIWKTTIELMATHLKICHICTS